jgi:hypothetical protein
MLPKSAAGLPWERRFPHKASGAIPECTFREIDKLVNTATECDYEHLFRQEEEGVSRLRQGWTTNTGICRSATVTKWFLNELLALCMLKKQRLGVFLQ